MADSIHKKEHKTNYSVGWLSNFIAPTPLQLIVAQKMRGEEGEDLIYTIEDGKYVSVNIPIREAIE